MSSITSSLPVLCLAAVASVLTARAGHAQAAPATKGAPAHPVVCAKGVRLYTESSQLPAPHDTVHMPPADGPVTVTSPEEAEAAELAMRARAGSVGATGLVVTDLRTDEGGMTHLHRSVTAVFASADSARAQLACKP